MSSKYFVRFLKKAQVQEVQRMLEGVSGRKYPIDFKQEMFEIKAPDGDVVFAGLKKDDSWVCRLHKEVFAP